MEIYYRHAKWLGFIFGAAAVSVLLVQLGVIQVNNKPSDIVGYSIFSFITFIALLITFASTRLYFDNSEHACIQERNYFWWQNRVIYPYKNILNIVVRLTVSSSRDVGGYKVGFTQETTLFDMPATKYIELLYFGNDQSDYSNAVKFAKEICDYSGVKYLDDTQKTRPF